jgi:hypothetical protein
VRSQPQLVAWPKLAQSVKKLSLLSPFSLISLIRFRKIRTDVGKFSSVCRTIADWNRLLEGAIWTFLVKTHRFRKRVRKVQ